MDKIKSLYKDLKKPLTKGEKKIAEYILANPEIVSEISALELGNLLDTSDASVVRFSKNIGFKGFSDLKTYLKIQLNITKKPENKILDKWNILKNENDIIEKVIKNDLKNIESFLKDLNINDIEKSVDIISQSNKIYIIGMGCSRGIAQFMSWHMKRIGINIEFLQESGIGLLESLAHLKENDSIILFTFPRYLVDEIKIGEIAINKKSKLILITSEMFSEISKNSNVVFKVPVDNDSFFNSYLVPMELCNVILTRIYEKNKSSLCENLKNSGIFKDYLYYEKLNLK